MSKWDDKTDGGAGRSDPVEAGSEQSFLGAFLAASTIAGHGFIAVTVILKSGATLHGVPVLEPPTSDTLPDGQRVTIGDTQIVACDVVEFSLSRRGSPTFKG